MSSRYSQITADSKIGVSPTSSTGVLPSGDTALNQSGLSARSTSRRVNGTLLLVEHDRCALHVGAQRVADQGERVGHGEVLHLRHSASRGAKRTLRLSASAPSPASHSTTDITVRNTGYSQPPPLATCTQPFGRVHPHHRQQDRHRQQRSLARVDAQQQRDAGAISSVNTGITSAPGMPTDSKNCAVPAKVKTSGLSRAWAIHIVPSDSRSSSKPQAVATPAAAGAASAALDGGQHGGHG